MNHPRLPRLAGLAAPVVALAFMHAGACAADETRSDWRDGAIVYQVMVDRYVPATDLDAKRHLYDEPRTLRPWSEQPRRGHPVEGAGYWSHSLAFWGGDLASLTTKVDHVTSLADVLYLNPIHDAVTNHKYDALDYRRIAPEYGDDDDLRALGEALHDRDAALVLDGVFNHMGFGAPIFEEARTNADSPYRDWFLFDESHPNGFIGWYDVANLPVLDLEHDAVRDHLWRGDDSVVRHFLDLGIDGWRLDVAYDIGPSILAEITRAAHETRPDAWVVGEVWAYPGGWQDSLDGVMNFFAREVVSRVARGDLAGGRASSMLDDMIEDTGIEFLRRSWIVLDNHDTPRLLDMFPDERERALAQTLQFALPGCPVLYYGVEAGMTGAGDPLCRGPMDWDAVEEGNSELDRVRRLVEVRRSQPALRHGDCIMLETTDLLAFLRWTGRHDETCTVLVNPFDREVTETFALRDPWAQGDQRCLLTGATIHPASGVVTVTMPPKATWILTDVPASPGRYDASKGLP